MFPCSDSASRKVRAPSPNLCDLSTRSFCCAPDQKCCNFILPRPKDREGVRSRSKVFARSLHRSHHRRSRFLGQKTGSLTERWTRPAARLFFPTLPVRGDYDIRWLRVAEGLFLQVVVDSDLNMVARG